MKWLGEFFKEDYEVYCKYNVETWFLALSAYQDLKNEFLVSMGIVSVSINPDAAVFTCKLVCVDRATDNA